MIIKEEQRNLFSVSQDYSLAHCISKDFALGAGIARKFDDYYNMKARLLAQYRDSVYNQPFEPCCLPVYLYPQYVFNLVTKEHYWQKPSYQTLESALWDLLAHMRQKGVYKLAIPHIGCGLDRLEWSCVYHLLYKVFEYTDTEILVCSLRTE